MEKYTVDDAFEILKEYKITTHKESVRRWLRNGDLKGQRHSSRKAGWMIYKADLFEFISKKSVVLDEEKVREKMWWELVQRNIFEGYLELKRKDIRECIDHLRMSEEFEKYVWNVVSKHKRGYATPRVPYLLDHFIFDSKRVRFDEKYESQKEQILYSLIEHLRLKKVGKA